VSLSRTLGAAVAVAAALTVTTAASPAAAGSDAVHYWVTCQTATQYGNLHAKDPIRTLEYHNQVGYSGFSQDGWMSVMRYGASDPRWGFVLARCLERDPRY
jgi:hypothetical protein